MKRILTILAILFLIGAASGLPNFGPAQGFSNRGDISIGGDLTVGDDADVVGDLTAGTITSDAGITATTTVLGEHLSSSGDANITGNLEIGGDLTVTGVLTTGSTISSGVISEDIQMAAGYDLDCASGASEFDWSLGTGIFKTTSGAVTIGGGTNAITLNGPVTGASAKNWTMVGASYLTIGSGGLQAVGDTIALLDALTGTTATFSGAVATGAQTVTGGVTASGTIQAEHITSTDDMTVNDDLNVLGDMTVAGSFTIDDIVATDDLTVGDDGSVLGDLSVVGALDVDGATTLDGLTVAETATFTGPIVQTPIVKNADYTVLDTDGTIFHVGKSDGHMTITMPTAADNAGKFFMISVTTDPGVNNVIIAGEGAETIDGAGSKTTTDAVGSFYYLYCDGLAYRKIASQGTWA